jgi:peroxiredoxin
MPELQSASQRYEPKIRIIGVDQGEAPKVVQEFADELGVSFTIPMDSDMGVGDQYRIIGLPTTFFIDRDGIIRQIWSGEMNGIILAEAISGILP